MQTPNAKENGDDEQKEESWKGVDEERKGTNAALDLIDWLVSLGWQ